MSSLAKISEGEGTKNNIWSSDTFNTTSCNH